jgi:hypothetical protein
MLKRARIAALSVGTWAVLALSLGSYAIARPTQLAGIGRAVTSSIAITLTAAPLVILFPLLWWWAEARFANRSALVRIGSALAITAGVVLSVLGLLAMAVVVAGVR